MWGQTSSVTRIRNACGRGETRCISEQGFRRSNLNKRRRKPCQIGKNGGDSRIGAIDLRWHVRSGKFFEISFVNERVNCVLTRKRRTRHGQVDPRRYQPRAPWQLLSRRVEEVDQCGREASPSAVAADRNVGGRNSRLAEKEPCGQRIVDCRGERMLGR